MRKLDDRRVKAVGVTSRAGRKAVQPLRDRPPVVETRLAGRSKKIQDVFVDAKVPRSQRESWPLVVRGDEVVAVPGIVDAEGIKAGQVDRPPCDGGCPTTTWRPGDLVGERYDLLIDAAAPLGRYQLITGMYDLATGKNLIWLDGQGNALGPHLPLGTVEVQP